MVQCTALVRLPGGAHVVSPGIDLAAGVAAADRQPSPSHLPAPAQEARAACEVLHMAPRSSKEDPRFVETYFKASRLSFIGSWKSRIEARHCDGGIHVTPTHPGCKDVETPSRLTLALLTVETRKLLPMTAIHAIHTRRP